MQSEAKRQLYAPILWFDILKDKLPKDSLKYKLQDSTDEFLAILSRECKTQEKKEAQEDDLRRVGQVEKELRTEFFKSPIGQHADAPDLLIIPIKFAIRSLCVMIRGLEKLSDDAAPSIRTDMERELHEMEKAIRESVYPEFSLESYKAECRLMANKGRLI